jgi:hypothetical protein
MEHVIRLVSFYEISSDLAVRLGSGEFDEVLHRNLPNPGIRVCVREPVTQDVEFRMRFGTATLTDEGPVCHIPDDESERRGVWAESFPVAMSAIAWLQSLSLAELEQSISAASPAGCLVLDLPGTRLRAVADPRSGWHDCDSTLATQALMQLGGDPEQAAQLLTRIRDQERAQQAVERR